MRKAAAALLHQPVALLTLTSSQPSGNGTDRFSNAVVSKPLTGFCLDPVDFPAPGAEEFGDCWDCHDWEYRRRSFNADLHGEFFTGELILIGEGLEDDDDLADGDVYYVETFGNCKKNEYYMPTFGKFKEKAWNGSRTISLRQFRKLKGVMKKNMGSKVEVRG
jgi:hypothetical protein